MLSRRHQSGPTHRSLSHQNRQTLQTHVEWRTELTRAKSWSKPTSVTECINRVDSSRSLGATLCKDGGGTIDSYVMIVSVTATMTRLDRIRRSSTIRYRLYKSIVVPILMLEVRWREYPSHTCLRRLLQRGDTTPMTGNRMIEKYSDRKKKDN